MCGRFASTLPPELIARLFHTRNAWPNLGPSWNTAPSQEALVVRRHPQTGERHLDALKWGLLPYWTKDPATARRPINARAETVASTGMFRDAFARRRCLVPCFAFYEWIRHRLPRTPYAFRRVDGGPVVFAGLWESFTWPTGEITRTFCFITTTPNALMAPIHDRMPVVLNEADWPAWLGEQEGEPASLLRPAGEDVLEAWPISTRVNTPRENDPDLLTPLGEADRVAAIGSS